MSVNVKVEFDQYYWGGLQKQLESAGKGNSVREVLMTAINETASKMKQELYDETKNKYAIRAGALRKSDLKLKKATKSNLSAELSVTGAAMSIRKGYKTRKNTKRKGAQGQVLAAHPMKEIGKTGYKAFLATMKSGYEAVFARIPGTKMKKKNAEKIKQIGSMARSKAVEATYRERIQPNAKYDLNYTMLKHINKVLGG